MAYVSALEKLAAMVKALEVKGRRADEVAQDAKGLSV